MLYGLATDMSAETELFLFFIWFVVVPRLLEQAKWFVHVSDPSGWVIGSAIADHQSSRGRNLLVEWRRVFGSD